MSRSYPICRGSIAVWFVEQVLVGGIERTERIEPLGGGALRLACRGRIVQDRGERVVQDVATASGVTFMTLEDKTGFVNLVVWAQLFAEYAPIIRTTSLLGVTGRLQVQEGIVHLIAERVWHPQLSRPVAEVDSRDFH